MTPTIEQAARHYYNENDLKAAAWLAELVARRLIPAGHIDTRSIHDVKPDDLKAYDQCHFFAGIAGWPRALEIAGVPVDASLWTGSCPCQPFSVAGRGLGSADERHLWPVWLPLIAECRPATIFGEQVASPAGREWLARVFADLEKLGYAVAGADLCAAGKGSPQIRQRLFWVASAQGDEWARRLGNTDAAGRSGFANSSLPAIQRMDFTETDRRQHEQALTRSNGARAESREPGIEFGVGRNSSGPWGQYDICHFTDGKTRRIESGTQPLASGVPARVVRLRGYGNSIVPQIAAEFIQACCEITN